MIKVKVDDDKYTVLFPTEPQDHGNFRALRYGEEWRDLTGDSLIYNLVYELNEARAENARLREALEQIDQPIACGCSACRSDCQSDAAKAIYFEKAREIARAALGDKS